MLYHWPTGTKGGVSTKKSFKSLRIPWLLIGSVWIGAVVIVFLYLASVYASDLTAKQGLIGSISCLVLLLLGTLMRRYGKKHPLKPIRIAAEPMDRSDDRLTAERKSLLVKNLWQDHLNVSAFETLPELLFAHFTAECIRGEHPKGSGESLKFSEAGKQLADRIVAKLSLEQKLFIALFEATHTPYVKNDVAFLFTRESFCLNWIDRCSEQFLFLNCAAFRKESFSYACERLRTLGVKHVRIDAGEYSLQIPLNRLSPPPEYLELPSDQIPVSNPDLQLACLNFFEELGQARYQPDREESLKSKEDAMLSQMLSARFLIPVLREKKDKNSRGDSDRKMQIPSLESEEGEKYVPAFTDWHEFEQGYNRKYFNALILSCDDTIALGDKDSGFAVNPFGFNLVFHEKNLKRLKEYRKANAQGDI